MPKFKVQLSGENIHVEFIERKWLFKKKIYSKTIIISKNISYFQNLILTGATYIPATWCTGSAPSTRSADSDTSMDCSKLQPSTIYVMKRQLHFEVTSQRRDWNMLHEILSMLLLLLMM